MRVLLDACVPRRLRNELQQQLGGRAFAVYVLRARTNRLTDLLPMLPALRKALERPQPGQVRELDQSSER